MTLEHTNANPEHNLKRSLELDKERHNIIIIAVRNYIETTRHFDINTSQHDGKKHFT